MEWRRVSEGDVGLSPGDIRVGDDEGSTSESSPLPDHYPASRIVHTFDTDDEGDQVPVVAGYGGVCSIDEDEEQEAWRAVIRERVVVMQARRRRKLFLWLGGLSLFVGVVLASVGMMFGWESSYRFPVIIGGYCAILATLLSILQILEHLSAFADPDIQTRIVRILVMVPIYAITSWLALMYTSSAGYLDLVRDMYESYAIYTFFSLMLGLLGGLDECLRVFMARGQEGEGFPHPWPLCCLRRWYMVPQVLNRITVCILQFMVLKPLCTVIVIVLTAVGEYGTALTDFSKGLPYITVVYNVSITAAFTGLLYFYVATRDLLREHDPLLKFACIKGVLFLSYWQALTIQILHAAGWLPRVPFFEEGEETRVGLQDFLICCEMLLFAIAHKFVFGAEEFTKGLQVGGRVVRGAVLPVAKQGMWTNLKRTLHHDDVRSDFKTTWEFIRTF
eukprot:Sspe_Gene.94895::Locus_67204_Transcript_1_1_Confidence_1.000_Length_1555::g.94895::m.94895